MFWENAFVRLQERCRVREHLFTVLLLKECDTVPYEELLKHGHHGHHAKPCPHTSLQPWRPSKFDPKLGRADNFNPASSPHDAFSRSSPYAYPHLQTNEDFLFIRGKKRPAILISPPDSKLATIPKVTGGGKLARNLAPIALIYSAVDMAAVCLPPVPTLIRQFSKGLMRFDEDRQDQTIRGVVEDRKRHHCTTIS